MCPSKVVEPSALYYQLLGHLPDDGEEKFTTLKFSWLKEIFQTLLSSAIESELMCIARARCGCILPRIQQHALMWTINAQ
ncbi:hypothetical protein PVK06_017166 [Gossypium arboreum]|uniref:Uncharacterized protein n=1 Tax=Gossypium arboreum TaxID=29729 RepID=A0ABR0Q2E7_GOSAR|nr:hypothetical protein PVK06_017166 [Gossypium arboreum]